MGSKVSEGHHQKLVGPAWRAFQGIADAWGITLGQQSDLLGLDPKTFKDLSDTDGAQMDEPTLTRISYVLGIYKALHTLLPVPSRADRWIKSPNSGALFGNRTAIDVMRSGRIEDLAAVRAYLDAQIL